MPDFHDILIASDFDRTMTDNDGSIPKANLDAVDYFIAHGGAFTICTGRSLPMFRHRLDGMRVNAPVILFNGAAVHDFISGATTFLSTLPDDHLEMARRVLAMYPDLRLELQGMRYHQCFGRDELRDAYLRKNGIEPRYVDWDKLDDTVLSLAFFRPFLTDGHSFAEEASEEDEQIFREIEALMEREYKTVYFAVRSMPRMIEMGPYGSSKGVAARWLANKLGRKTLVCAGDAPNDLPMLEEADRAFIPKGCDPAMEGRGFEQTACCDEGMIACIVERLSKQ